MSGALPLGHLTGAVLVPLFVGLATSYWRHGELDDLEGTLLATAGAAGVYGLLEFGGPLTDGQQYLLVAVVVVSLTAGVLSERTGIDESD